MSKDRRIDLNSTLQSNLRGSMKRANREAIPNGARDSVLAKESGSLKSRE